MSDKTDEYEERRRLERKRKIGNKKALKASASLAREKIRSEGRCRNSDCTSGLKPEWHHAVPRSKFSPRDPTQNSIDNAVPLCHFCHQGWHNGVKLLRRNLHVSEVEFIIKTVGEEWANRHYPLH